MSPYRPDPEDRPTNVGPVRCRDCEHWATGPMDCSVVPEETRYRSLQVVNKHWTAESEGCSDYERSPDAGFPGPTASVAVAAAAVATALLFILLV